MITLVKHQDLQLLRREGELVQGYIKVAMEPRKAEELTIDELKNSIESAPGLQQRSPSGMKKLFTNSKYYRDALSITLSAG